MRNLNPLSDKDVQEIPDGQLQSAMYARLRDVQYLLMEMSSRGIEFKYEVGSGAGPHMGNYHLKIALRTPA